MRGGMSSHPPQPPPESPPAPPAEAAEKDERDLDEALESTFPASDPVAAETPER
jgi:hypothetical protein